ncbi:MAG: hypothetical protein GKR88_17105 [Flavobacteriaceae bacterium]|nr:MAG: hypothetical protein GKR88_17105 [Flavobacteriaceae bacterium]
MKNKCAVVRLAKNNTKSMTEKNRGTVNLFVIAFALAGGSLSHPFVLGDFGFTASFSLGLS